jgi:hypothetical protein
MYVKKFAWNGLREHKRKKIMEFYVSKFRELLIAEMYSKLMRET